MKKKLTAWITAAAMGLSMLGTVVPQAALAASAAGSIQVEYLDRGISAINTGSGMLVSWRFLANDSDSAVFQLYRNNTLVYTSSAGESTCYLDKDGKSTDKYRVDTLEGGKVVSTADCTMISNQNYFQLNLDPPTGSGCTYSPNDCSVGDADGDGMYEIFMKWDPSNSKDNSQKGKTGNVFIDCYRLDGTRLWRIDLGKNIRAGAHYTQFFVADFDCDGKAEMTCKTADGTVDGKGTVIGDASKDYRNSNGYVLSGPEYYTLFDGSTGAALDTINYAAVQTVQIPGLAVADVLVQLLGLILGRNANGINVGVHAVGQREVHDAVLTAEGHRRFCRFLCQRVQARATSAGKDHCHNFFCHSFILPFNINISVVRK